MTSSHFIQENACERKSDWIFDLLSNALGVNVRLSTPALVRDPGAQPSNPLTLPSNFDGQTSKAGGAA